MGGRGAAVIPEEGVSYWPIRMLEGDDERELLATLGVAELTNHRRWQVDPTRGRHRGDRGRSGCGDPVLSRLARARGQAHAGRKLRGRRGRRRAALRAVAPLARG